MLTLPETLPHFLASAQEETLALIRTPGVNLCLWERAPRPAISALLAQMLKSRVGLAVDVTLSPDENLTASTDPALRRYEMNYAFPLWLDDMQRLVTRFREISGSPAVRLRLERVADQGCAAFHADSLALRMLCTYHGPGTQWLENDNLRRDELGLRGRPTAEANAAMAIDETRIHTAPAWHVMIFKGRSWPGEENNALVHRSFPVCCADHARIRLCLDVPSNYAGC